MVVVSGTDAIMHGSAAVLGGVFAVGALMQLSAAPPPSYGYLSPRAQSLVDALDGGPDAYNARPESERASFEAIVHALESDGLLDLLDRVTAIWGEAVPASSEGKDQFRISVVLVAGAPSAILGTAGYIADDRGHVKLPNGQVIAGDFEVHGARHADTPSLQVSWRENNPTVGEVDIDYREKFSVWDLIGFGHMAPSNSDVRSRRGLQGALHYQLHSLRYGPGLVNWWRARVLVSMPMPRAQVASRWRMPISSRSFCRSMVTRGTSGGSGSALSTCRACRQWPATTRRAVSAERVDVAEEAFVDECREAV